MEKGLFNEDLYKSIDCELRKGRKTKEQLLKMLCDAVYKNAALEQESAALKDELEKAATGVHKIKNERGAGRKPLSDFTVDYILKLRDKGHSIRYIAEMMDISVGAVHNVIKASKN